MPEEYENAIEWLDGQKMATITLHSMKLRNRVLKLAEQNPGKVKIIARPDDRGQSGYLLAHLPASWIKINPPGKGPTLSEEQRAVNAERIKAINAARKTSKNDGEDV